MTSPTPSTAGPATRTWPATSTGSKSWDSLRVPLAFLLLASVYLLYLPHTDFVLDDWFQFLFYRQNQAHGWTGELAVIRTLLQNKLYSVFQLFWLGYTVDSLVVWTVGYAPRILFALALAVHALNAWLLYRLLARLRLDRRMAGLAGCCFLLIPTAHGSLFWTLNTGYYRLSAVFLFLYLLSLAGTLERGVLTRRTLWGQALLVAAVLFCGGAIQFHLLLFGGLWMMVCLFPRDRWKVAARAIGIHWVVVAAALAVYVPFINRIPPSGPQIGARYDFSREFLLRNWRKLYHFHLEGMSGFGPHAYYHLKASASQLLAAALAALVVLAVVSPGRRVPGAPRLSRVTLFAAGMIMLAYAPLLFLIGGTLRHYYTFSPYLSLLLVALCWRLPAGRRIAVAALCGYFAAATVAEIQQCWIPMSRNLQAVKAGLRLLRNLEPGDPVVIPGTPMVIGAAPSFAFISAPFDRSFAEVITGVPNLEFWREIVIEKSRPRFFHRYALRDASPADLARAHVLVGETAGPYTPRRYWAEPLGAGEYRFHCLKDFPRAADPSPPPDQVYFPKPFEHGNLSHMHY